jgi:hypothetical protein
MMTAGGDFDDPKFLEAFIIRNTRQLAMAGKLLFPVPDRGLDERLYRIRAKTALIWGDSDRVIPPAYGDAFPPGHHRRRADPHPGRRPHGDRRAAGRGGRRARTARMKRLSVRR